MASVEATGQTVDDAIDAALEQLDLDEDQVDIDVLEEGGADSPARVRATPRAGDDSAGEPDEDDEQDDGAAVADEVEAIVSDETLATAGREILEDLLDYMGFPGEVDVLHAGKENGTPTVSMAVVEGDSMGALIGRRGETLQALQFICQLLVNRRVGHWTRVLLDIEGYRSRRERYLKDAALRAAEKAMRYREPIGLDPMMPSERRVVHLTLAEHADVTTHSEGEGSNRHVIVEPTAEYVRAHGGPAEGDRGRPAGDRFGRGGGFGRSGPPGRRPGGFGRGGPGGRR